MDTEEPHGWAVEVLLPPHGDSGAPTGKTYYVAVTDAAEAEEAVRQATGTTGDTPVKAQERIRMDVITERMQIPLGEVGTVNGPLKPRP